MKAAARLAFFLSAVSTPSGAADVNCKGGMGGHLGAQVVCDAVRSRLAQKAVSVVVEVTRDQPMSLAARLSWSAQGRSGHSPEVDVTASDRALNKRAADRLAQGLIAVSNLPQ